MMTARTLEDARAWTQRGTRLLLDALAGLGDDQLDEPAALPGWTRKQLIGHIAQNARALHNLLVWARTGVETPMYASSAQRDADIAAAATQAAAVLREEVAASALDLDRALSELAEEHWQRPVRTAQGRTVPASEVPWMRAREVMVHAVDLGAGVTFTDLGEDFATALVDDVVAKRDGSGGPALVLDDGRRSWIVAGAGEPVAVSGPVPELAAYLTGRPHALPGNPPSLPRWL